MTHVSALDRIWTNRNQNSSASHAELRKLGTRLNLISNSTRRNGGLYIYANATVRVATIPEILSILTFYARALMETRESFSVFRTSYLRL
jgi:hypothetical protein